MPRISTILCHFYILQLDSIGPKLQLVCYRTSNQAVPLYLLIFSSIEAIASCSESGTITLIGNLIVVFEPSSLLNFQQTY